MEVFALITKNKQKRGSQHFGLYVKKFIQLRNDLFGLGRLWSLHGQLLVLGLIFRLFKLLI